ncbi:MAG: HPF/RaiA family ribosome-associated protein [Vicinamibacterales bacterium]
MTLIPTQTTFRGLPHSAALDAEIRDHVAWLEQFAPDIVRCRVLIELPHRHRQAARQFHVRLEITVPGAEPIVVNRQPSLHRAARDSEEGAHHKDTEIDAEQRYAGVAVREAFDAARRRLEDVRREQRGDVKTHAASGAGRGVDVGANASLGEEPGE